MSFDPNTQYYQQPQRQYRTDWHPRDKDDLNAIWRTIARFSGDEICNIPGLTMCPELAALGEATTSAWPYPFSKDPRVQHQQDQEKVLMYAVIDLLSREGMHPKTPGTDYVDAAVNVVTNLGRKYRGFNKRRLANAMRVLATIHQCARKWNHFAQNHLEEDSTWLRLPTRCDRIPCSFFVVLRRLTELHPNRCEVAGRKAYVVLQWDFDLQYKNSIVDSMPKQGHRCPGVAMSVFGSARYVELTGDLVAQRQQALQTANMIFEKWRDARFIVEPSRRAWDMLAGINVDEELRLHFAIK